MPVYLLPRVRIFQEFSRLIVSVARPLYAHVAGGHAQLVRFAETDEQSDGLLGAYDPLSDTAYAWPNRPAGAVIDPTYTRLFIKNALLQYFADLVSSGSEIVKVAGFNNRVRSDSVNFKVNGDYARDDDLLDRDVQLGDIVKLRCFSSGDPVTIWTYVKAIVGDEVDAIIAAASPDASNHATQGASSSITKTGGADNCVSAAISATAYNGLNTGTVDETYTVTVTEGSVSGDYTTASLRVLSASGRDDDLSVTPAGEGVAFPIGANGLTLTFNEGDTVACSQSATNDDVSADDLVAGQEWTIVVHQAFTKPVATSAGAYDDRDSTTYIIEVTKGGLYAASPEISVTTTNGVDLSGPTVVTAAASAVAVGTHGVTVAFSATGLRLGDKYYVTVTGIAEGPMRTLVLGHNMPTTVADDSEVDVTLFIKVPSLEVSANRLGFSPITNWDHGDTEITVNSGIVAYEASWTDGGVLQPLDVVSASSKGYGTLYVEYRAWLAELCTELGTLDPADEEISAISGPLHPDNELKWGVFKARQNSNGVPIKYSAVCDPDSDDSWADMLELVVGREDVYGMCPLTRRRTVLDLYEAHINSLSVPDYGQWRVGWFNLTGVPELPIIHGGSEIAGHTTATTTDGEQCLCTFTDDPDTTGSQYTILICPGSNGDFLTAGVQAGDLVRSLYTGDGFGGYTYTEFEVDEVVSEDEIRLKTGPGAAQSVAAKVEIWRTLSPTEESAELARDAGSWGSRRIRAVWPDQIESAGTVMEGYFLCAALAGLSSGILPHQGMTNMEVSGFTDVSRTIGKFNRTQLDAMAVAGTWIVTQSPTTGQIYNRQALTTGDYEDINERQEMICRNVDSISFRLQDELAPFIGIGNAVSSMAKKIEARIDTVIRSLQSERATDELGGQIITAKLVEPIRQHPTAADRFIINLSADVPESLEGIDIHLVI